MGNKKSKINEDKHFNFIKQHKPALKFPSHIHNGDDLIIAIGMKSCKNYDRFRGGEFWYIYESVMRSSRGKCRFEIQSNMPIDKIEHPSVNIHMIELKVYLINDKAEMELLIAFQVDLYLSMPFPSELNGQNISKINSIIGIDKLSYNDRASWDILMNYMEIDEFFKYSNFVPFSDNMKQYVSMLDNDSICIDPNSPYQARFDRVEVEKLEAQHPWERLDITKYPYIQMLKYEGDELRYCEVIDELRNVGIITITFNSEIIYNATYPIEKINRKGFTRWKLPIYKSGMVCDIDERNTNRCVFKFVEKLLQLTLKTNISFGMKQMEKEWIALCNSQFDKFTNLVLIFYFGNYKYFHTLNLRNALKNPSTFSDIIFSHY